LWQQNFKNIIILLHVRTGNINKFIRQYIDNVHIYPEINCSVVCGPRSGAPVSTPADRRRPPDRQTCDGRVPTLHDYQMLIMTSRQQRAKISPS